MNTLIALMIIAGWCLVVGAVDRRLAAYTATQRRLR
jgi:hypothetical protein